MRLRPFHLLLNFIYPGCCPYCGRTLGGDNTPCPDCARHLKPLHNTFWLKKQNCSLQVAAAFSYESVARQGLLRYKYRLAWEFGPYFAKEFMRAFARLQEEQAFDAIVYVPPSNRTGDNHLIDVTRLFSKSIKLPVYHNILLHRPNTLCQHHLSKEERIENAVKLFDLHHKRAAKLQGKRILLLDDVVTTGATMLACADLLYAAGAEQVSGLAICHTLLHNQEDLPNAVKEANLTESAYDIHAGELQR